MKHLILKFRKLRHSWGDGLWLGALVLTESPALSPSTNIVVHYYYGNSSTKGFNTFL